MNLNSDNILLIGSIHLVISIIAGKTSYRFGVPVVPGGSTVIMPGDKLVILAETKGSLSLVKNCIMKISHENKEESQQDAGYKI